MEFNKPFSKYNNGEEMWRDTFLRYGTKEATNVCGNYLEMNLKREQSENEKDFSRELFSAMYGATAHKPNPIKIVYPYTLEEADRRCESSYYHMNRSMNKECSRAITKTRNDSCYEPNFYNLENAAWIVLIKYGFNRVCAVLAHQIQKHEHDGRYSQVNKKWAKDFIILEKAFDSSFMNTHATVLDGFTDYVRKLYISMGADRYTLPGYEERGEVIQGFKVYRAVMVEYDTGYAIAHNPNAVEPYVCWQFKVRDNGERHYNWGVYGSEQVAIDSFNARVFIHAGDESNTQNKGDCDI